ncbi:hypothetical protein [Bradyrhizobium sp. DOA9]|uniref:hypothetical protein n=1 Tax=Bradyrhizobium sp. DOA9 TaxID=1126627 RepID=UPI0005A6F2B5|nr:hypothetical protein [Bradyrhizobium sp. DOA9]
MGQVDEYPNQCAAELALTGKVRIAPIDDSVTDDEQGTIDLYFRRGLIGQKLDAATIVDSSLSGAIVKGSAL